MEKMYIKSRLDCPPPDTRQLLKEKDLLIQKQQEKLKDLDSTVTRLKYERDILYNTLNKIIVNVGNVSKSSSVKDSKTIESGISTTPPSSSSSSSNSTSSLQSPQNKNAIDSVASDELNENLKAILFDNKPNQMQFLSEDYLQFIQNQLEIKSIDSCRSSMSSTTKLDNFCSLSSTSNLIIHPTSISSLSLSTTPISSASSSLSSLKQKDQLELELEEEKGHLNKLVEVKSFKSNVNSISSSMILSPNVKRPINKNPLTTGSNFRIKEYTTNTDDLITPITKCQQQHLPIDYELSNEMKNKEIELLYRKYGGHLRCKRAARVIQHAYREYKLRKNYYKLCENNIKRRSFELMEPMQMNDEGRKQQQPIKKIQKLNETLNDVDYEDKMDAPSMDFEKLLEQFNGNKILNNRDDTSENSSKKESITSNDYKKYKYFDEFNHMNYEEPEENDFEYEQYSNEPETTNLVKTGNKSLSTSSIHLSHLSSVNQTQTAEQLPQRAKDLESISFNSKPSPKIFNNNINPPVSNRSLIKNQNMEHGTKITINKSCHSSVHSVYSSMSSSSCNSNSPKVTDQPTTTTKPLVNKNLYKNPLTHQAVKLLTKSPCSVNSLFSASNKQRLLLTKDTPKKQKSKVQQLLKTHPHLVKSEQSTQQKTNEIMSVTSNSQRLEFDSSKRKYLVGLNLFNRKPEKGINYLIEEKFLDRDARSIAEFLFNRNCLSKQMIGDYISNTQDKFILQILTEFVQLIDLHELPVDEALRKFQTHFRMPGESQKIEHLINVFSLRYVACNLDVCRTFFNCADETINVLAYAIILLNTSMHNPNVKANERMKFEQFLKMTKGIDNGHDIEKDYMQGIYERVKQFEFKPGKDHTNSVNDFEKNLVGPKKPTTLFSLPHRRLVCLVQLYEIFDLTKKEKTNSHQRECFLFNDILVVTKVFSKKKNHTLYTYRCGFPLQGMNVVLFVTNHYQYGIRLIRMPEKKVLITFNARNENDQQLFCRDLAESIAEANEMDQLRIKTEMDKFKSNGTKLNTSQINNSQDSSNKRATKSTINKPELPKPKPDQSTSTSTTTTTTNDLTHNSIDSGSASANSIFNLKSPPPSTASKHFYSSPCSNVMAPPATPKLTTPFNRLHKRTLSNSLIDLNTSYGNSSRSSNNQGQNTLQRAGSECSLVNSSTTKNSFNYKTKPHMKQTINKTPTNHLNKEIVRLETSTENQDLFDSNHANIDLIVNNLYKLNTNESALSLTAQKPLKDPKLEADTNFSKKLSFSAQVTGQNSLRVKHKASMIRDNNSRLKITEHDAEKPYKLTISLEERLRQNKLFANDNYEYINYFSSPSIKKLKNSEYEKLIESSNDSTVDSFSPISLNNQNSRSSSAKYFTISSSAGHKFRQIIKKYV